jgi:superfamily II RNA helicase
MLSATIDQPARFAKWCERGVDAQSSEYKEVYLASTNHRVVPLSHYGYLTTVESIFKGMKKDTALEKEIRATTNKMILLQNANGVFQESGYRSIVKTQQIFEQKQVYMKRKHVLNSLALHLRDHDMLPAIGFVFSRRNVELCAHEITVPLLEDDSKVRYIVARECEQIVRKLPNFQEYLGLPEYQNLVGLLEKGIGIHHSGMIPILREIVELMISKKYIKLLFATESFAIGLDCPIKTAIFTGLCKFDGSSERTLLPHEYTQMAGRAGRRGIDTIGHVVHCNNLFRDQLSLTEYKTLLSGTPQTLVSKFRISYPLVLSILQANMDTNLQTDAGIDSVLCSVDSISPKQLTNKCEMVDFVNKSMIFGEISKSIENQKKCLNKLEAEFLEKERRFQECSSTNSLARLSKEKCLKYLDLEVNLKTAVNRKRKDIEKEIQSIREESKNWLNEIQSVKSILELEEKIESEKYELTYLENYIQSNIEKVLDILFAKGFVEQKTRQLTTLGKYAANIREIHPLIIAKTIESTNYFEEFSPKCLVGLLSIFVDIKVPEDLKSSIPITDNKLIKRQVHSIIDLFQEFQDIEIRCDLQTGIHYEDAVQYDIIDLVMQWCDCTTEEECKVFIYTQLQQEKEISTGDFTKAMLKISAIGKELTSLAEVEGRVEWLEKLASIDGLILKYIAANQSLYV